VIVEKLVEWRLAGETEVLGENLPRRHLSTTNPTCLNPGSNTGRRGGKPATNRLSYGAAIDHQLLQCTTTELASNTTVATTFPPLTRYSEAAEAHFAFFKETIRCQSRNKSCG
jgi:hypothetical protein